MNGWIDFNSLSAAWSDAMWRACWQGTLVIVLVWGLARFARPVPPPARVWLWRLAYGKLLLAFFFASSIDLPLLRDSVPVPHPELPALEADAALSPAITTAIAAQFSQEARSVPAKDGFGWADWLFLAWLLCAGVGVARLIVQWRLTARLRTTCQPIKEALPLDECRRLADAFGIKMPALLQSPVTKQPFLTGIFRPAIILPAEMLTRSSVTELRLVLAHELAHMKRKDLWWMWLQAICQVLFFFHPLVWLTKRPWSETQEIACDELAMRMTGAPAAQYGSLLLDMIARAGQRQPQLQSIGIIETKQSIQRRLLAMKSTGGNSRQRIAVTMAALVVVTALAILPWRLVAENTPNDELARLKTENAVLREELQRLKTQEPRGREAGQLTKELESALATARVELAVRLAEVTEDHPDVKRIQVKIAALEKEMSNISSGPGRIGAALHLDPLVAKYRELLSAQAMHEDLRKRYTAEHPRRKKAEADLLALWDEYSKLQKEHVQPFTPTEAAREHLRSAQEHFTDSHPDTQRAKALIHALQQLADGAKRLAPLGLSELTEERKAAQRELYEAEIEMVEQQLRSAQKRVETGVASTEEVLRVQQDLNYLKRELAALESRHADVKTLVQQQIQTAEKQLELMKRSVGNGVLSSESLIPLQREILKLRRQLMALE
jgi:beta-lactamase regulating signal transducer with metallopeptidase domain